MVTLVIMDGFGIRKKRKGNAIALQGTPYLDKLCMEYPNIELQASGNYVGLPDGQMGNSEAGHLTIGAGRRFYQPLERVNQAISNGSFFKNAELLRAINHAKQNGGALHIIGLASDGGVHSHTSHIKAVLKMAKKNGLNKVFLHAILDGRDTGVTSGYGYVADLNKLCKSFGYEIKTLCGRVWAMDREKYYDRTQRAYEAIVLGQADFVGPEPLAEIKASYETGVTDEFFEPTVIGVPTPITDNDAIIICNVRKDRMRELLEALTQQDFNYFPTAKFNNLCIVGLVEYDDDFTSVGVAFKEETLENGLAKVLAQNGKRQLHISETAKFPHITYYFDCGRDEPYKHERHRVLEGIEDLKYENHPEMRAFDITNEVLDAIADNKYDFIVVNFPNCDMIGHTADMEAVKAAVRIVDKCAYAIAMGTLIAGGECIITSDHGNAEDLIDVNGQPKTYHTSNPVPFVLVGKTPRALKPTGELANIAPTILDLMNIEIPKEMEKSLIDHNAVIKTKKAPK